MPRLLKVFFLFAIPMAGAIAQSRPAATIPAADLSTPKATLLSLYQSLKAGDIPAARTCLVFSSREEAQSFDITYTPLYGPLALIHALQVRFGPDAGKPFGLAPLEKSLDDLLAKARTADITITGDTAAVADSADVNPSAETELTDITFKKENAPTPQWKVTASTFMTAAGENPPHQQKFMRALRDATANAVRETSARLARGDFKTPEEAFADYQSRLQQATQAAAKENPSH